MEYFEIKSNSDSVRIEILNRLKYNKPDFFTDKNTLNAKITVKGGVFHGEYLAYIMTTDFAYLKDNLAELYLNLSGETSFCPIDEQIVIKIKGDGIGHFHCDCEAQAGIGNVLQFELEFDQTIIPILITQLESIIHAYPVVR
jgi:hypothetical protein